MIVKKQPMKTLGFARVGESDFDCALRMKDGLNSANGYLTILSDALCDKPDADITEMLMVIERLKPSNGI